MQHDQVRPCRRIAAARRLRLPLAGAGIAFASVAAAAPPITVSPGGVERIEHSAWLTVESVGNGQVILFAGLPAFRGFHRGTARLFANAVVFGPGLLGEFLEFLVASAAGAAVHRKETPLGVGRPIASPGAAGGDPLIVEVNALFPFGPASYRIDRLGTPGRNLRIVHGRQVARARPEHGLTNGLGAARARRGQRPRA